MIERKICGPPLNSMSSESDDTYLNLQEMSDVIKIFLERNGFTFKTISNCNDIQILYQLIKNEDQIRLSKLSWNLKYIAGLYFELIHDIKSMMGQYLNGVDLGCPECMNLLGRYYYRNKDYVQMMKFWQMAIEKKNIDAIFNLSKFFEDEKQYDNMINALKIAIDLGSEKAILSLASYYQKNKEFEKMIETYRQGIHNGYTNCMSELGNYYMSLGDKENTIKYYTAAAKTNPDAMYKLGKFYERNKDYPKMMYYYNKAIQYNHTESMIRLGDYYKKIKNYELMLHTYKMAASTNPDAMNRLGIYFQKKKQYPEMMNYYESAIKLGCVNSMNNLAIYYESVGEYGKMKMLLEKAIEKKSCVAMYNMGLYYEKMKDYEKMAEYFMMSYQNGRVFDHSEIKLMKKSILSGNKIKLMNELKRMVSEKKKKFKEIFTFKHSKEDKIKQKIPSPHIVNDDIEKSKKNSPPNLLDLQIEEKPKKTLFNDMGIYKIIQQVSTDPQKKDWMKEMSVLSEPSDNPNCHQDIIESKIVLESNEKEFTESKMEQTSSGMPELSMYRFLAGLHK